MKKKVTISGDISGVIATGSFANLRPGFTWIEEYTDCTLTDLEIQARRKELYEMSFLLLKEAESKALIERIERERADLRFCPSPTTGKMLPSVTSIINYDADFFVSAEDLRQYGSQGSIVHRRVTEYIKEGKWISAKEIPDLWTDILIISKGSLKLPLEVGDFPGFLKKYPIANMDILTRKFDDKHGFCGEPDILGYPEFAESVKTIFDIKRTPSKIKDGLQLAGYCQLFNVKQGIIIPLNDKTQSGFSKPIIYDEKALSGYWQMFLEKRKAFKARYGI